MLDIEKIKKDFTLLQDNPSLVYLDSAASSQTPDAVLSAMNDYYTKYRANTHRGLYGLSTTATNKYEEARNTVANFLGCMSEEIIFTSGATGSMNMLMQSVENSLKLVAGDEILTTITEHHSSLLPAQELAKRKKLILKHISITDSFGLDYEEFNKKITAKTRLVILPLASNVLGTMNDIAKVVDMARKHGALVVVDASAAIGHASVDVRKLDCDFLLFSGHKMCGPTGVGVLYGKKDMLKLLRPGFFGGNTVEEVSMDRVLFLEPPHCFEAGTQNIAGVLGLAEAVRYLDSIGTEEIHTHVASVVKYAILKLSEISDITLYCQKNADKNIGIISFAMNGIHPHDIAEVLSRENIAVRAGHHCAEPLVKQLGVSATVRVSFYLYNTKEDVDKLVFAIKKVQNIFK